MAKMTVYHGGYTPIEIPEIRIGKNTKDFGSGFYCTIIKEQAQRWAKRYDTKIVSIYDVRFNSGLQIKEFKEMTDEWLDFTDRCSPLSGRGFPANGGRSMRHFPAPSRMPPDPAHRSPWSPRDERRW